MTDGSYDDEARQLAKWKRRIAENKYIREHGLLEQSNLLSYAMHKLSHQRVPLSLGDRFTIWFCHCIIRSIDIIVLIGAYSSAAMMSTSATTRFVNTSRIASPHEAY